MIAPCLLLLICWAEFLVKKGDIAGNNNALRIYATSDSWTNRFSIPADGMQYHNQHSCLDVTRIDNWEMPARNALKFFTTFQSKSSEEATLREFIIIKQPNGKWLARF